MGKSSKDNRDVYYRLAKEEGWRARSAYKLLQLDEEFNLFENINRAVDLCAAPGSWSQVLRYRLNSTDYKAKIIAVDLQPMANIPGVIQLKGDITKLETCNEIKKKLEEENAQLVVCDGAPDVTGLHDMDEFLQMQLLVAALNITTNILQENGTFVAKIFKGQNYDILRAKLLIFFEEVYCVKPQSSRSSSIEAFVVCKNFSTPKGYKPTMVNLVDNYNSSTEEYDYEASVNNKLLPFIQYGDLNGFS